jgi:preprotein translocase subunit SecD
MILYYRLPGLLAVAALLIYALVVLAIFKLWPVVLTLAGVAGFILSIGMAVDANILIFSRVREELKEKKDYSVSLEEGFRRAWPAIRDTNFTTLLVSLILFFFGTSFVKGFAFTLILGDLMSMFSDIIITRNLLELLLKAKLEKWYWLWR